MKKIPILMIITQFSISYSVSLGCKTTKQLSIKLKFFHDRELILYERELILYDRELILYGRELIPYDKEFYSL